MMRKLSIFILIIFGLISLPFGVFFWIAAALLVKKKETIIIKQA